MPELSDQKKFELEYHEWICSMAKEVAFRLAAKPTAERAFIIKLYRNLQDPRLVFRQLSDPWRVKHLGGKEISNYIVIETDAITIFPSIHSLIPGALDFAVAMNRRFFFRDLWFPIIALNAEYIKRSNDEILAFALEHEFEMARIYKEISANLRALSGEEKREIARSAQDTCAKKRQITQSQLLEDEKLMIQLSMSQPLIPKPYAELALLLYLEDHFLELRPFGVTCEGEEERSFGKKLYEEFREWTAFSKSTFAMFVREILAGLRDANKGYG